MSRVLIIGAGGVATVAAFKVAKNADVFTDIMIASRTLKKCDAIVEAIGNPAIRTAQVDADDVEQLVALMSGYRPDIVMNLALAVSGPHHHGGLPQDRVSTISTRRTTSPATWPTSSTAGSGPTRSASRRPGLTAILGCGFDPG
jgi:saccharopine dehydrogenase (NAD+, L-lysine-forming)